MFQLKSAVLINSRLFFRKKPYSSKTSLIRWRQRQIWNGDILDPSYFCEIWTLCVSGMTYDNLCPHYLSIYLSIYLIYIYIYIPISVSVSISISIIYKYIYIYIYIYINSMEYINLVIKWHEKFRQVWIHM